jgi:hypothetical protein
MLQEWMGKIRRQVGGNAVSHWTARIEGATEDRRSAWGGGRRLEVLQAGKRGRLAYSVERPEPSNMGKSWGVRKSRGCQPEEG